MTGIALLSNDKRHRKTDSEAGRLGIIAETAAERMIAGSRQPFLD